VCVAKQRTRYNNKTIALTAIAIAAVLVLFAAAPLTTIHQAHAFWGGGWGWGGDWGGCGGCCGGCGCGGLVSSWGW